MFARPKPDTLGMPGGRAMVNFVCLDNANDLWLLTTETTYANKSIYIKLISSGWQLMFC